MKENKRFNIKYEVDDGIRYWEIIDNKTQNNTSNEKKLCEWLNELHEEVMNLRAENTKFKLVVKDIVGDLEQQAETREPIVISKAYAKWIKDNVNLRLNGDIE